MNIRDLEENSIFQKDWEGGSNEAFLVTNEGSYDQITPGHIEYLIYQDSLGNINQFGSILNNYINPYKPNTEYHVYSALGNDTMSIKGLGASMNVYDYQLSYDKFELFEIGTSYSIREEKNSLIIFEDKLFGKSRLSGEALV